jgi:hypothetical protein
MIDKKDINNFFGEIIGISIILIPALIIYLYFYFEMKHIMKAGDETRAVIVSYEFFVKVKSKNNYMFCVGNNFYQGHFGDDVVKYGDFIFGDEITIKFNPKKPTKNYPIIIHNIKKSEIIQKYNHELPKNKKRDIYKLGMWKGWSNKAQLDKFIKTYPISKEAFPCLPPEYYGEF